MKYYIKHDFGCGYKNVYICELELDLNKLNWYFEGRKTKFNLINACDTIKLGKLKFKLFKNIRLVPVEDNYII